tara:strand:+ start:462 stop:1379 length:918 start_codon:yes stop_codon:yes gene_type:complete
MPTESLKLFLTELIDYAALFPPANLDLISALRKYRNYIEYENNWMFSKFIIPVNQLEFISESDMEYYNDFFLLDLSILSGDLSDDINKYKYFKNKFPNKVKFSGLETSISNLNELQNYLNIINSIIIDEDLDIEVFIELPYGENWIEGMHNTIKTLFEFNKANKTNFGYKLRCGGINADMFPSPIIVAKTILNCIENNVPMKFTAGLHHPFYHFNNSVNTMMYGFFNIFISGMVAQKYKLDYKQIIKILTDGNNQNFIFNKDALNWKDYQITNEELRRFRMNQFISYGSCSFDEPIEDLINLGLF